MHIVALATCHNRKDKTLAALRDLQAQALPAAVSLEIVLVDDGSHDGTAASVRAQFPDVTVLDGPGDLFWAGGMLYGWHQLVATQSFDHLLVFNDDIRLDPGALQHLLATSATARAKAGPCHAVAAGFRDSAGTNVSYGGVRRSSAWHPLRFRQVTPNGDTQPVDTMNMNLALVTAEALRTVGFLSPFFRHKGADYEFGLKLRKAGGHVWLTPETVGVCDRNPLRGTSRDPDAPRLTRFKRLISVKEELPSMRWHLYKAHGGPLWPLLWALPYIRVLVGPPK